MDVSVQRIIALKRNLQAEDDWEERVELLREIHETENIADDKKVRVGIEEVEENATTNEKKKKEKY